MCVFVCVHPVNINRLGVHNKMATISTTFTPLTMGLAQSTKTKRPTSNYITGLNSFGGLKAQNNVITLGLPVCTQQSFAKIVSSVRSQPSGRGGAFGARCNAAGEIFRIAAIMNGLVLVGVAVGFVLLRIEAFVEESEA